MDKYTIYDPAIKFRVDYQWPDESTERDCPKCNTPMQLNENEETYFGKPWWCPKCQWQFSEEELTNQD
jgi:ssDNA-binding Zn-finger/Zn-ribbon topoisomerase 1